jgi:hypothetical protein
MDEFTTLATGAATTLWGHLAADAARAAGQSIDGTTADRWLDLAELPDLRALRVREPDGWARRRRRPQLNSGRFYTSLTHRQRVGKYYHV